MEVQVQNKINTEIVCAICGKKFHRKPSYIKKLKDINHATCSKECMYKMRKTLYSGEGNPQFGKKGYLNASWKSDIKYKDYKFKRVLDHPFRDELDMVPVYRLVADKYLTNKENSIIINGKTYLKQECVVHHIDFNKQNDSPDNLYIFSNKSMHILFHNIYGYRVNSITEFEKYYQEKYINKILDYTWMYTAYVKYGLSTNKISKLFDIPYKSVEMQVKNFNLKRKRQEYEKQLICQIVNNLNQLSNKEITYEELQAIPSERGTGALGSSGK